MHEVSLAESILNIARRQAPGDVVVRSVELRAGPLRGIEPNAMQWAWKAVTSGTTWDKVELLIDYLPWTLQCPDCSRLWQAEDELEPCRCGSDGAYPVGGDELTVVSIEVDELEQV